MRERHKRDIVLKTDPVTNEKYWSNEVVTVYKPDEEDRLNAVLDILKGEKTAEEVRKKFNIATVNSVYTWIGKYVTQEKALSLEEQTDEDMARKSKDDQIRELQAQLKQARKEAELEKLRAKAYDTMINVAEETFNIPIRKNLAPNGKSATRGMSGIWTGHSLRAVWLQQAILLQMGQS